MPSLAPPAKPRLREKPTTRAAGASRASRARSSSRDALSTTRSETAAPVCRSSDASARKRAPPPSRLTTMASTSGRWGEPLKRLTRSAAAYEIASPDATTRVFARERGAPAPRDARALRGLGRRGLRPPRPRPARRRHEARGEAPPPQRADGGQGEALARGS